MFKRQCRQSIIVILFVISSIFCVLTLTIWRVHDQKLDMTGGKYFGQKPDGCLDNNEETLDKSLLEIIKQRNTLSQQLNMKQQRFTRLQCKVSNFVILSILCYSQFKGFVSSG